MKVNARFLQCDFVNPIVLLFCMEVPKPPLLQPMCQKKNCNPTPPSASQPFSNLRLYNGGPIVKTGVLYLQGGLRNLSVPDRQPLRIQVNRPPGQSPPRSESPLVLVTPVKRPPWIKRPPGQTPPPCEHVQCVFILLLIPV